MTKMKIINITKKVAFMAVICLCLTACNKLTQTNYDKVKQNMSMQEVVAILGDPTSTESIDLAGVSGTSAIWKNKDVQIAIQFLNGTVYFKTFSKSSEQQPQ